MTYAPLLSGLPDLKTRVGITLACERDAAFREAIRQRCKDDTAFFLNAFGWTFDPRPTATQPDLPFILYPFQVDYVRWLDDRFLNNEDGIVEKSREIGVTWVTLGWLFHKWLFHDGFQALVGSRKEDLVDNKTLASHFGKLQYMLEKLPGWLVPTGFRMVQHRTKLKLANPENGNMLEGESANAQFSRQGRYTVILFDEAAFWEDLASSWRAAGSATRCRIAVSTANGQNAFYRLRYNQTDNGQLRYNVLTLHASLHPLKTPEWIEAERQRMTPEDFAQEIDISYSRSVRGVVYPTVIDIPVGSYPYVTGWSLYVSWDFGVADDTALVWWARDPATGKTRPIASYSNSQKPIDFYVPFVRPEFLGELSKIHQYSADEMELITLNSLLPQAIHYGDPAGNQRNQVTGTSVIDELRKYKIYVFTNDKARDFRARKSATELGLRLVEGFDERASGLRDALINARFPERNPDSNATTANINPIHDWTSHYRTATEYFFVNVPPVMRTRRPDAQVREMAYDQFKSKRR